VKALTGMSTHAGGRSTRGVYGSPAGEGSRGPRS